MKYLRSLGFLTSALLLAASAPIARAQFGQQGGKLTASDAVGSASFGGAVAVSADGNTAIFGGENDNQGVGAVWVFTRTGGVWSKQTKITVSDSVGYTGFGASVAISSDGNTAFIGGPWDNGVTGASWVFVRSAGVWTEQAKLLAQPEAASTCSVCHGSSITAAPFNPQLQGSAVSLSADGNTAIVGSMLDHHSRGSAWIYTRSGSTWTQTPGTLLASDSPNGGLQGSAVALSGDGTTATVAGEGAVWAYILSGGNWTQQGDSLVPSDAVDWSDFGGSLALSADGNTLLAGGYADAEFSGAAWVFTRTGGVWTQQGSKLTASDATGIGQDFPYTYQGCSVSLSADGNTAIVGGYGDGVTTNIGAIWEYTRFNGVWTQRGNKLIGTGAIDSGGGAEQGFAVALSGDGATLISSGPNDNSGVGAVWVFTYVPPPLVQQGSKITGTNLSGSDPQFGYSVAISADGNTAIVGTYSSNNAYIYTRTNGAWTLQQAILGGYQFGWSVALSADGNTAVIGAPGDTGSSPPYWSGVAYAYTRSNGVWTRQAKLWGPGGAMYPVAQQGWAVAISADGNTALVGGPADGYMGAVWVFTRSGTTWTQQGGKLVASGGSDGYPCNESQGTSVALSADGNTALVGDPAESCNGGAWAFTRDIGGNWTQQGGKLLGSGAVHGQQQGYLVALSADGNTAILGSNFTYGGGAYVFTRSHGVWSQQGGTFTATGIAGGYAQLGGGVALSSDGNTALVGGPSDNSGAGATWMYTRTGGVWSQLGGKMAGTGVAGGYSDQGAAVALSGDAHTAILSGYRDNTDKGAVWMFSSWPEPAGLRVVAPASAMQGAGFQFGVTAVDSSGVPVGNYSGPVHFTSSDAAAVLTADSPLSYGAGKFTATLNTPGAETITAADAAMAFSAGTSNSIRVTAAGVATHFDLAAPETALTGTPFSFTVTAADASDNPVASYAKTVHFTSSDSAAVLPPDAPLVNGTGTFTATLQTTGRQFLSATDTTASTLSGRSADIAVSVPPPAATTTVAGSVTAGYSPNAQTITLSATVTSTSTVNSGTVSFTVLGSTVSGNVANGSASASFTVPAATAVGSYPIQATYNPGTGFAASSDTTRQLTIQQSAAITIQTNPAGLQCSVDGGAVWNAPQTLYLAVRSHTIAVATPQAGLAGTQYVFTGWSDNGAASHTISVGSAGATYSASFKTQYRLTMAANPSAAGSVDPASGSYFDSGTVVTVTATPTSPFAFSWWSGDAAGSANPASVTMNAAKSVTANFVTTLSSCDINGDGITNAVDVQIMVNEALGAIPAFNDLNRDRAVDAVELQIVANAALGLGCEAK